MKKLILWTVLSLVIMVVCPWLFASFAGGVGMGLCFLLFFVVNPIFSAVCGIFAGFNIKRLWVLPLIVSILFLAGAWLVFEMGQLDFLLYCGIYLVISVITMVISALVQKITKKSNRR